MLFFCFFYILWSSHVLTRLWIDDRNLFYTYLKYFRLCTNERRTKKKDIRWRKLGHSHRFVLYGLFFFCGYFDCVWILSVCQFVFGIWFLCGLFVLLERHYCDLDEFWSVLIRRWILRVTDTLLHYYLYFFQPVIPYIFSK